MDGGEDRRRRERDEVDEGKGFPSAGGKQNVSVLPSAIRNDKAGLVCFT